MNQKEFNTRWVTNQRNRASKELESLKGMMGRDLVQDNFENLARTAMRAMVLEEEVKQLSAQLEMLNAE